MDDKNTQNIERGLDAIARALLFPFNDKAATDYTPVWTSTGTQPALGNGVISGKVMKFGKYRVVKIEMTLGSTSTIGTGVYRWSLPEAAATGQRFVGSGWALRGGTAFEPWPVSNIDIFATQTSATIGLINAGGGVAAATRPWANGDIFVLEFGYWVD